MATPRRKHSAVIPAPPAAASQHTTAPQPQLARTPRLDGRVALITGSTRGLGKAMALALGQAGARVALNYCNHMAAGEQALAELRAAGCQGGLFRGDVTDELAVPKLVARIVDELGPIDILVINATPEQPQRSIENYDWQMHQSLLDYFLKSPFLLTRAVLPHLKKQRWGRILNIGSDVFRRGVANFSAYVAAKGAQAGWTRSIANELAPWQITVNIVSPGWIPVERHQKDPKPQKDAYRAMIPLQRWGLPQDVAGVVAFLCSDAGAFLTGQDIAVNGGITVT